MAPTGKFYDATHILPPLKMFLVAGGTAGNHTVTGITTNDKLLGVSSIEATASQLSTAILGLAGNLLSEFSIDSAGVIDNTGGTDTTGAMLIVLYADYDA